MKKLFTYSLVLAFLFITAINCYGAARELTLMHWAGTWGDSARKLADQFEKETGVKITFHIQETLP